ncbi:hypothetical protein J5N97_022568 [Dioscorea zingiberensis]|uniref:Uncharacterized protein n=1 Tax=Dioscorea zingiberensis TaxID=325984 RepID=A0A9D5HAN9_9LILI|nr:hypothetical protein J5N97_022568 [Dioscorea zingiberensis]
MTDRRSKITERRRDETDQFSFDACIFKLLAIPGIGPEEACAAVDALKCPEHRIFFMRMPPNFVEYWLNLRLKEFCRQAPPSSPLNSCGNLLTIARASLEGKPDLSRNSSLGMSFSSTLQERRWVCLGIWEIPEHLEEVESGAEPASDGGGEEPWPAVDHSAEVTAGDSGLPKEKGDGVGDIRRRGCKDLRAHAGDSADFRRAKA